MGRGAVFCGGEGEERTAEGQQLGSSVQPCPGLCLQPSRRTALGWPGWEPGVAPKEAGFTEKL